MERVYGGYGGGCVASPIMCMSVTESRWASAGCESVVELYVSQQRYNLGHLDRTTPTKPPSASSMSTVTIPRQFRHLVLSPS